MKLQILSLFLAAISSAQGSNNSTANGLGTTTYRIVSGSNIASLSGAQAFCESKNGSLADVTIENFDFLKNLVGNKEYAYINPLIFGGLVNILTPSGLGQIEDSTIKAPFICQFSAPRSQ